ncbi:sulfatase-like hydrolase/transferase [Aporhodopirellula aestuarii]|uniref:Sulfatase-like hydrolase/transferase n=1 Tax=Aporhodopirellula aestuarii TaxID=2950107 RepID=A0ABT0TYH7_9BACT|nr:sulfatase-like hydrolase/transferase [Aporhodopirellula aestuarii]MCM2369620.1 sulfatase-like hydrolase/transferase [Aporhodopirellula aestuarii]
MPFVSEFDDKSEIGKPLRILFLFLFSFLQFVTYSDAAEHPPNVVLIFVDDLGYGDVGCYGATKVKTPNIDQLAKDGRRFTDAHSASAVCTASRYGLLTGEYPMRKNIWGPAPVTAPLLVDTETLTIADVFKDGGYNTAAIGKWHLGFGTGTNDWKQPLRPGPLDLGFDYYFGVPLVNSAPPYVFVENDRVFGRVADDPLVYVGRNAGNKATPITPLTAEHGNRVPNFFTGASNAHSLYNDFTLGTTLAKRATDWIREQSDNPFFLYFATTNIHHPFTPAPRFQGSSECGLYGDFIHELDWIVGEVMTTLEEKGIADNTLVIFTSDNGGMFNHGGQKAFSMGHRSNGELLGFKFGAWEGGHRVPFIARWPGHIQPGTTSTQLISGVDMLATFAELTQQTLDKESLADSVNVLPALIGEPESPLRDTLILCPYRQSHLAVRKGKWVYIDAQDEGGFKGKPGTHAAGGAACASFVGNVNSDIENGRIKKDAPPAQLYDLENDVAQTQNLYRENPEVASQMKALLDSYRPEKAATRRKGGPQKKPTKPSLQSGTSSPLPPVARTESATSAGQDGNTNRSIVSATTLVSNAIETTRPNFVIIFTDDQGYGDLSCYGAKHVSTPRIDQMAAEGSRLTNFYVAAPVCTPSRAALMTGCYPKRIEMATGSNFGVLLASDRKGLNPEEITIAEVLKSAGYKTGMFGKWHLGDQPEFLPTRQGFDEFFGLPYSHDIHPFHGNQKKHQFPSLPLLDGETVIEMDPDADYLTKRITEHAVAFIEQNKQTPFFLYVPHPIPHRPLHASPPFMEDASDEIKTALEQEKGVDYKTRDKIFKQAISEIDWSVGEILDALKDNGIDDNTLVIFTSDNGPSIPGKATPLSGKKGSTLEGGMREPTVIRWPGKIPAGKPNDELMTTMDLLPTFAKLAGAEIPTDRVIDGKDIWPTLSGAAPTPHEAFFYHSGNDLQAVRSGKWKLHTKQGRPAKLFNLETDISEKNNVIKSHPDVVQKLVTHMDAFAADIAENSRPAAFVDNPKPLSN